MHGAPDFGFAWGAEAGPLYYTNPLKSGIMINYLLNILTQTIIQTLVYIVSLLCEQVWEP